MAPYDPFRIHLPFDRSYAEESRAPEMERAYCRLSRRQERNAYIGGLPVIEFILPEEGKDQAD